MTQKWDINHNLKRERSQSQLVRVLDCVAIFSWKSGLPSFWEVYHFWSLELCLLLSMKRPEFFACYLVLYGSRVSVLEAGLTEAWLFYYSQEESAYVFGPDHVHHQGPSF